MPSDYFEDNVIEEVAAPAPTPSPAPAKAKEVKVETAPALAPLEKLSRDELVAPVAARAASITNRIPGVANPQAKVPAAKETPATNRAGSDVAKFLAARARRNG